jgi:hypothetical protein
VDGLGDLVSRSGIFNYFLKILYKIIVDSNSATIFVIRNE